MSVGKFRRGGITPNQVNICIHEIQNGEVSGEVYSRYSTEPWKFQNLVQLVASMESFFNKVSFPQSAVQLRGSAWDSTGKLPDIEKGPYLEREFLLEKRGECLTFLVSVRYRQNATWQGNLLWIEGNQAMEFKSALELMMMINKAIRAHNSNKKTYKDRW